ncbi:MAG: FHA domain-containing protein [Planctomycetota bacterium]
MVAKLIVASGKSAGRSIAFKQGKLLIGRAEDCDVRPLGEEVSRRHCVVRVEGEAITVEDLKSRNGTYVHGERVSAAKVTVADGVIIRVGPLELKVSCAAPAPAQVAQPAQPAQADDVSRWLMADDEPAGMFDTTQSVKVSSLEPVTAVSATGSEESSSISSALSVGHLAESGDDSAATMAGNSSGIQAIIAARSNPVGLPTESRAAKSTNSKDAAAEAIKKFFGKR